MNNDVCFCHPRNLSERFISGSPGKVKVEGDMYRDYVSNIRHALVLRSHAFVWSACQDITGAGQELRVQATFL